MITSSNFGYGEFAASTSKRSTKGFTAVSGSPQQDIDFNNFTMRQRGRLMYMGNPIAASAVNTHRSVAAENAPSGCTETPSASAEAEDPAGGDALQRRH